MTLPELQQIAKERTEAVLGAWTDKPTGQTKAIIDEYRTAFKSIDNQLKEAYAKNLAGIPKDDYYNEMVKYGRLEALQKQISAEYNKYARRAGFKQIELGKTGMSNTYYQNMYSVNWFSGLNEMEYFAVLSKNAIDVSVISTDKIWRSLPKGDKIALSPLKAKNGTIINTLRGNHDDDLRKINKAITQGLLQGKSYTTVSKDIRNVFNTTASNAVRIARTEGIRNMNSGAYENTRAAISAGIDTGREVVEVMDDRTRNQSASIDGQRQKGLDPFIYPGGLKVDIIGNSGVAAYDINERGSSIDYVEGIEPTTIRGVNPVTGGEGVANFRDFERWMKQNDLVFSDTGRIVSKGKTAF